MTLTRRSIRTGLVAIAIVQTMACGGDDDGEPTGTTGSFTLSVSPAPVNLAPGQSTYVTVTLTPSGGFNGNVNLTISGTPAGVSATATPAVLSGTTVASRIDLTSTVAAAVGSATITITGSSGSRQATATFTLMVEAQPDYSLSILGTVTVSSGSSSDVFVSINRLNFTGGIALSLVNPPTGIAGTFTPTTTLASSVLLALTVAANVAPGSYAVTILGTAGGPGDRTTALQLTVIPASTAVNNVEYQFCQADDVPAFFAYQDGSGSWQPVSGTLSNGVTRFAFKLTTGRGGILIVYPFTFEERAFRPRSGSRLAARRAATRAPTRTTPIASRVLAAVQAYETIVFHGSTAELAEDGILSCAISPATKTIRGTVAGLGNFQYSVLSLGSISRIFEGGVNTNPVTFAGVEDGVVDFVGSRLPATGSAPDRAVIFRNLNIPDGGALPSTIDFNGPASFVPASATVTLTGGGGERFEVYSDVVTLNQEILLWNDIAPSTNSSRPWAGLPASHLALGELHHIIVFASPQANSPDVRVASKFTGPVSNQTVAFGPAVNPATVTEVGTAAYPRLRFQGALPAEYNKGVIFTVNPDEGTYVVVLATNAWLTASGTTTAYDLTMPNVAGLPGFPIASRLKQGTNSVTTEAFGFTGSGTFEPRPAVGIESRTSIRTRQIDIP